MSETKIISVAYVGPARLGLGFEISGIDTYECNDGEQLIKTLREISSDAKVGIIFVDELLAGKVMLEIDKINENALPAIVLLANPEKPEMVSAKKLEQLMIKAIGSDIFS